MSLKIIYGEEKYFQSFHQTLDDVAKEHIHIEMVEAPTLEVVSSFQKTIIEKVELTVYPNNLAAKRLYENCGFKESGIINNYRKWNDQYFDVIQMELFF